MSDIEVDVQYAVPLAGEPTVAQVTAWVEAALAGRRTRAELTVRVVGEEEMAGFNRHYRHREGPTNVLSFPYDERPELAIPLLGDIVVCAPVVAREAAEQDKRYHDHFAHMVVHGTLHLIGYDHMDPADARVMEDLEIAVLAGLSVADPYREAG
jgi:probable rRNA maturation factor